jgi:hypothetical protein
VKLVRPDPMEETSWPNQIKRKLQILFVTLRGNVFLTGNSRVIGFWRGAGNLLAVGSTTACGNLRRHAVVTRAINKPLVTCLATEERNNAIRCRAPECKLIE